MKRITLWLLLAAMLLCAVGCGGKGGSEAAPLLWKVTDQSGHTLYLFGTIHVGDERSEAVLKRVSPVLEDCDALAVEFDLVAYQSNGDAMMRDMMQYLLTDGSTIEDYMPSDLYDRAFSLLNEAGLFPSAMRSYNLAMWAQLVETAAITAKSDLSAEYAMDMLLIRRAYEKQIPVLDVESAQFQMQLLNSFDDALYLAQIETTLDSLDVYKVSLNAMYELWLSGNRDAFWAMVAAEENAGDLVADYNRRLIGDRNVNMAETAKEYLNSGRTVFFAVGAAHMANDAGIVKLLTDAGFTVEEISY